MNTLGRDLVGGARGGARSSASRSADQRLTPRIAASAGRLSTAARVEPLERRTLLAAGDLDASFAGDGKALYAFRQRFGGDTALHDVLAQPDGKLVAVGYTSPREGNRDILVARFTAAGQLDTTFGTDGVAVIDYFGRDDVAYAVTRQADGKLLVAGSARKTDGNHDAALVRLTTSGRLDTTFSADGKASYRYSTRHEVAYGVAVAPGNKIVIGGESSGDFFVARVSSTGARDTTFNGDGLHVVTFGGTDGARGVAVQGDGKIVLGGYTTATGGGDFAVARLTAGGNLDTSFSSDGKQTVNFGARDTGFDVALDASGRIVVGGYANPPSGTGAEEFFDPWRLGVARLTTGGALDTSFSSDGRATTPVFEQLEEWEPPLGGIALLGTRIVVSGGGVYRFSSTGALDATYERDGLSGRVTTIPGDASSVVVVSSHDEAELRKFAPPGTAVGSFGTNGATHGNIGAGEFIWAHDVDAAGRGILVGHSRGRLMVVRVLPDGGLDTSFGGDGRVIHTAISGSIDDVTVLSDGRMIVSYDFGDSAQFVRLLATGALDTSYGNNGITRVANPGGRRGEAFYIHSDGSAYFSSSNSGAFDVYRVTAGGVVDTAFNSRTVFPTGGAGRFLTLGANGKVLVGTIATVSSGAYAGRGTHLWRLNANGSLDTSFSGNGHVPISDRLGGLEVHGAAGLADGRVVLSAIHDIQTNDQLDNVVRLVRLTAGGALDAGFGSGGIARVDIGRRAYVRHVVVQSDGKYIAAGDTGGTDVALVRFTTSGRADTTFGGGDGVVITSVGAVDQMFDVPRIRSGKLVVPIWIGLSEQRAAARWLL